MASIQRTPHGTWQVVEFDTGDQEMFIYEECNTLEDAAEALAELEAEEEMWREIEDEYGAE